MKRRFALPWIMLATTTAVFAQTNAPAPAADRKASPEALTLSVSTARLVTLQAMKARAMDIAQALSRQLQVPVRMSPMVAGQTITLRLSGVPVEDLLQKLAPQVYIDYETRWDPPREDWVGVELTGFNEREPNTPVEPKAFMVLAGSTEDDAVTEETLAKERSDADEARLRSDLRKEGPVLEVSVKDGLVSVRARRQMAAAILLEAASKAGLGFETRGDLDQSLIDIDIRHTPIDQLPAALARPGFGVLMRRNLTAGTTRPVAVLLGSEASRVTKPAVRR